MEAEEKLLEEKHRDAGGRGKHVNNMRGKRGKETQERHGLCTTEKGLSYIVLMEATWFVVSEVKMDGPAWRRLRIFIVSIVQNLELPAGPAKLAFVVSCQWSK